MMARAGEDAITVEIIVGANSAAGTAQARSDAEAEQQPAIDARQDETAQDKSIKEETPTEPKLTSAEEAVAPVQKEVAPPEQRIEDIPPEPKPLEPWRPKPTPSTPSASAANSIGRGE